MARGEVSIQNLRGNLRLYWSWQGKRYYLSLGLPDDDLGRVVAEQKANQIRADCLSGNFDASLNKYKQDTRGAPGDRLNVHELFSKFMNWKERRVYSRTMEKYEGLLPRLETFFKNKSVSLVTERDTERFKDWLGQDLAPVTLKERIGLLKACWEWAAKQELVEDNPWGELRVRVPLKPMPRPFTKDEVYRVLEAFRQSRCYMHYADFVEFMFRTGLRTGEGIGLRWQNVAPDFSQIWIGESITRGIRKETKTNLPRTLNLAPDLQQMLQRRQATVEGELVFPAPRGGPIDDHNFRNRAWLKCLEAAGVEYRKPYVTRSTFVSHCLAAGINPADVAALTGHNIETLYRDYAGSITNINVVPELEWD